jgi:hypothetical protein
MSTIIISVIIFLIFGLLFFALMHEITDHNEDNNFKQTNK